MSYDSRTQPRCDHHIEIGARYQIWKPIQAVGKDGTTIQLHIYEVESSLLYPYAFVAGPNKHDTLLASMLSQKSHHSFVRSHRTFQKGQYCNDSVSEGRLAVIAQLIVQ